MNTALLNEIQERIGLLSESERDVLFHDLLARRKPTRAEVESAMAAMAADPDIQREVREINEEFAVAEMDGLENF